MRDALGTDECKFIKIVDEQQAGWSRTAAMDLMTNWLTAGEPFDAVFANNDEMAIGAIQAMKSAGVDMKEVIVVGVDATQDGLAAMRAGDLDVTVFQNATAQAAGAVDAALALARGQAVDQVVYIPFELVTPDNMDDVRGARTETSRTGGGRPPPRLLPPGGSGLHGHRRTPDHEPVQQGPDGGLTPWPEWSSSAPASAGRAPRSPCARPATTAP